MSESAFLCASYDTLPLIFKVICSTQLPNTHLYKASLHQGLTNLCFVKLLYAKNRPSLCLYVCNKNQAFNDQILWIIIDFLAMQEIINRAWGKDNDCRFSPENLAYIVTSMYIYTNMRRHKTPRTTLVALTYKKQLGWEPL